MSKKKFIEDYSLIKKEVEEAVLMRKIKLTNAYLVDTDPWNISPVPDDQKPKYLGEALDWEADFLEGRYGEIEYNNIIVTVPKPQLNILSEIMTGVLFIKDIFFNHVGDSERLVCGASSDLHATLDEAKENKWIDSYGQLIGIPCPDHAMAMKIKTILEKVYEVESSYEEFDETSTIVYFYLKR